MNLDLQNRIEEAIKLCSVSGINVRDGGLGACIEIANSARSLAAKNPMEALRRIQISPDRFRYIPLEGARLSKVGVDADDCGGVVEWYSVERMDGQSFAIAHCFTCGQDDGAKSCDLSRIPEFLLLPLPQKELKEVVSA